MPIAAGPSSTPGSERFTLSDYTPSRYIDNYPDDAYMATIVKPEQAVLPRPGNRHISHDRTRSIGLGIQVPEPSSALDLTILSAPAESYIPPSVRNDPEFDTHPSLPRSFSSNYRLDHNGAWDDDGESVAGRKGSDPWTEKGPVGAGAAGTKVLKWWEKVFPTSTACRLLLLIVVFESLIDLAIEGNILWRFNVEVTSSSSTELELENKRRLPVYLVIFGLAHLWQLILTMIAIHTRNTIQVIAVTAFNFAFLGYAVIEIAELRQILGDNLRDSLDTTDGTDISSTLLTLPLNVLTAVVIAVVALGSIALVILSIRLRTEFGWQRYRFLGADLQIRRLYIRFQVFECICYFSAFFCAGFGIQFIWLVLQRTDVEYIITWIMFPVSILLLVIGRFAAKYENKPFMTAFMVGLFCGCAYFIFKLVRIWQQRSTTFPLVSKSLTVFDILSLVSLVGCLIGGGVCWRDFGKGLKPAVLNQPNSTSFSSLAGIWRTGSASAVAPVETEMSAAQKRISIC